MHTLTIYRHDGKSPYHVNNGIMEEVRDDVIVEESKRKRASREIMCTFTG